MHKKYNKNLLKKNIFQFLNKCYILNYTLIKTVS